MAIQFHYWSGDVEPIWDAPWGLRQFSVLDPDGNLTTFHAA